MNTDQAYELLQSAGVSEEISIQTVRRWLRERKIKYEGTVENRNSGYILENTDQALYLLKDAGVAPNIGIQVVQKWLQEGKIQNVGRGEVSDYISEEKASKQLADSSLNQDRLIRELKVKIKVQNDHIKGIEELHRTSITALIQQKENLKKEIVNLENEKSELQIETRQVLRDNLELRKELLKLREELSKKKEDNPQKTHTVLPSKTHDFRQKLGLSRTASHKEVIASYKRLLKLTHPDHGGNATAFHFIKTDYDHFKNSLKG